MVWVLVLVWVLMLVLALVSQDGRLSSADLGDFVVSTLRDPIARTTGVGDFMVMGAPYAMRIWLDPARLHSYDLMPQDVIRWYLMQSDTKRDYQIS